MESRNRQKTLQGKKIALIGCGDIGCRLAPLLLQQGGEVSGFRRNSEKLPAGIARYSLDVSQPETLKMLEGQHFDYVVITLSPGEMSDEAYRATYVDGLKNILAMLETAQLRKLIWVSSTSVYGQADGSLVDESSATEPDRYAGKRQLEAEKLLPALGKKACVVRFSGIYREGRHHLLEQLLEGKLGSRIEQDYFTNRIHVSDCAGVLVHLIGLDAQGKDIERLYLASDCLPVRYGELIRWLADETGASLDPEAKTQTPRVGSKRCSNRKLLATGYEFIYTTYKEGFREIIRSYRPDHTS